MAFPELPKPQSLLERISETDAIDYKAQFGPGKKGQCDLIKDIGALANSGGGVLVFGVDGEVLKGIPQTDHKDYDPSRIDGKIRKHLSPVPQVAVDMIEHNGKKFPFVKVAPADITPVVVCSNLHDENSNLILQPGSVYVRQNTQTVEVSSAEAMRQLLDRFIDHHVYRRMQEFLRAMNSGGPKILEVDGIEKEGFAVAQKHANILDGDVLRTVSLIPTNGLNKLDGATLSGLLKVYAEAQNISFPSYPSYTRPGSLGSGEIRITNDKDFRLHSAAYFKPTGEFFWATDLLESVFNDEKKIYVGLTIEWIVVTLTCVKAWMSQLGSSETYLVRFTMRNVADSSLVMSGTYYFPGHEPKGPLESDVFVDLETSANAIGNSLHSLVIQVITEFTRKFGWGAVNEGMFDPLIKEAVSRTRVSTHYR